MVKAFPNNSKYKSSRASKIKLKIRSGCIQDTISELGNINWNSLINSQDLSCQQKFNIFYDTINDVLDTCQPLKCPSSKEISLG